MQRGDVYFCEFAQSTGSEQRKTRPVVIIQNNTGNKYSPTTIVVPITSIGKKPLPTHVYTSEVDKNGFFYGGIILCEQIFTVDKSRLQEYCGPLSKETMLKVNRALKISIDI